MEYKRKYEDLKKYESKQNKNNKNRIDYISKISKIVECDWIALNDKKVLIEAYKILTDSNKEVVFHDQESFSKMTYYKIILKYIDYNVEYRIYLNTDYIWRRIINNQQIVEPAPAESVTTENPNKNQIMHKRPRNDTEKQLPKLKSKHRGVTWNKERRAWMAYIHDGIKQKHIGYYDNEDSAAEAVKNAYCDIGPIVKRPNNFGNGPFQAETATATAQMITPSPTNWKNPDGRQVKIGYAMQFAPHTQDSSSQMFSPPKFISNDVTQLKKIYEKLYEKSPPNRFTNDIEWLKKHINLKTKK